MDPHPAPADGSVAHQQAGQREYDTDRPPSCRVVLQIGNHIIFPDLHTDCTWVPGTNSRREQKERARSSPACDLTSAPDELDASISFNDFEPLWWLITSAILLLDEALRSGTGPNEWTIRDIVSELRSLRNELNLEANDGTLKLPIPFPPDASDYFASSSGCKCDIPHSVATEIIDRRRIHVEARRLLQASFGSVAGPGELLRDIVGFFVGMERGKVPEITEKILSLIDDSSIAEWLSHLSEELKQLTNIAKIGYDLRMSHDPLASSFTMNAVARGGFGEIFKLESRVWGTLAVKRAKVPKGGDPDAIIMEFNRVLHLRPHINVLPMMGASYSDQTVLMAMPWAGNGSLDSYLRKNPDANRRYLLHQVSSALAHIHKFNLVHGDLHMKNILISDEGNALLCDFGLSKALNGGAEFDGPESGVVNSDGDYSNAPEGIPVYIAPERHIGRPRSRATDIFAFGMLCFETYSGTRPLPNCPNPAAVILALCKGERPRRTEITRSDFTNEMWQLVQRCWAPEPKERPPMDLVELLLREMETPEERRVRQSGRVTLTTRFFRNDDKDLLSAARDRRMSDTVRAVLRTMEEAGLRDFLRIVVNDDDITPLSALLAHYRLPQAWGLQKASEIWDT